MQSKNQAVILGISIFEKTEQTIQSSRSADRVRKKRPPSYLAMAPGLQTLFFTFTKLWTCSVQKWSLFGRGKYFLQVREDEWSNRLAENDKNSSAFVPYRGHLNF